MVGAAAGPGPRLLDREATAAVVFGAHDWTEAGLGRAPSFLRSAKGIFGYLIDSAGLGLDPALVLDLFDDTASAGDQLARIRDTLDLLLRERREEGRPVADLLVYYVGHGHTDDQNHLALLVRRSRRGVEAETGIKAPDLARVLRVAAPQQRRLIVLDCCFSEAAARDFIGQSAALDQAVAATAAKDLADDQPRRGTLLLCSSPVGEVSIGAPGAARTLFSGAVLDVLRLGAAGRPAALSFADLRDQAYHRMVDSFGANAPRPVLHQVNAAQGDLTRVPAFPNPFIIYDNVSNAPSDTPVPALQADKTDPPPPPLAIDPVPPVTPDGPTEASLLPVVSPPQLPHPIVALAMLVVMLVVMVVGLGAIGVGIVHVVQAPDRISVLTSQLIAYLGHAPSQFNLGVFYANGSGGLEPDDQKAARLYRLAADQGHVGAQNNLGVLYADGRGGLPKDDREAARLYKLAADQGNANAQFNLGSFYQNGRGGLAQDDREAARLYKLSADQGNPNGQVNLGFFYENGRGGLPKDAQQATQLYQAAARTGVSSAQQRLRNLGKTW